MRKCGGRDSGSEDPDVAKRFSSARKQFFWVAVLLLNLLHKNMAPGKTHVNSKLKHKFQAKKRNSSGFKKAKNISIPKKKVRLSKGLVTFRNIFNFSSSPHKCHKVLSCMYSYQWIEIRSRGLSSCPSTAHLHILFPSLFLLPCKQ